MAYVGWNDSTGGLTGWPPAWQEAYRSERPPFDPEFSETDRQMGRVPERIRTWPGARVSGRLAYRRSAVESRLRAGLAAGQARRGRRAGPAAGCAAGPADDPSPCRVPGGQPAEADGKSCDSRSGWRPDRLAGGLRPRHVHGDWRVPL